MPSDIAARWEKAKRDFEGITGRHKPDPKGKVMKAFGHTGVSGAFKKCDQYIDAIENENRDQDKKARLIAAGAKYVPKVAKAAKDYLKVLDTAVKDEVSDKGEKTTYSKGLKFLRARLDHLESAYEQKIDGHQIAIDQTTSGMQKATLMIHKALRASVANAVAGCKKVKADPTVERYNEIFNQSDNIIRKIQVQLISAASAQKRGLIPSDGMRVDPRFVADKMTPWQAENRTDTKADETWDERKILSQVAEATKLVKLGNAFLDDLAAAAR